MGFESDRVGRLGSRAARRLGLLLAGAALLGGAGSGGAVEAQSGGGGGGADSAVVFSRGELRATGRATLAEALQVLLPAFNYPRPSNAGGSDPVPAASLRGLGPDRFLVLVDGKRRPGEALLQLSRTIGRGESPTDLNAISLQAVERVEVFPGPSGARFGGGATGGVINVVLGSSLPRELAAQLALTDQGDGAAARAAGTYRVTWGSDGFVQLSGEYRGRGATNRALSDGRPQFFSGDPRNEDPRYTNQLHERFGDPRTHDASLVARFGTALPGRAELLGSLRGNRRWGESADRWRRPLEDATVRALFPTGFLPLLVATVTDRSADLGGRGRVGTGDWQWEASAGYGANTFRLEVRNTANPSLGALSPTRLRAGALGSTELSAGITVRGVLPVGLPRPLALSAGTGIRSEGYRIEAGERDSYRYGAVPIPDGPNAGGIAPLGAQGFPGFMPSDSFHRRRESIAGYGEIGVEPVRALRVTGGGRIEHYWSGASRNLGALTATARYQPVAGLVARAAVGTGFRPPSLAQEWFQYTTVPLVNNVGLFDLLLPATHPIAQALGAPALRAERSGEWTAGVAYRRRSGPWLEGDYYRILVRNRIGLTGTFTGSALQAFLEARDFIGVGAVRFLANVADVRVAGWEARAGYDFSAGGAAVRLRAAYDHHRVVVERVDSIGGALSGEQSSYFPAAERTRIESGEPGDNAALSLRLEWPRWRLAVHTRRYGAVRDFGPAPDGTLAQTFGAKWLGDLEAGYAPTSALTLLAGIQNLLGTYPDRNNQGNPGFEGNSYFGMLPYNPLSPFGFRGRIATLRAEWHP